MPKFLTVLYCIPTYVAYCIVVIYMNLNVVLSLIHLTTCSIRIYAAFHKICTCIIMPCSGFLKRKQDFPLKKLLSSALVSIVLSRVIPGIIKITLFALIHFAYLFMCIC